MNLITHYCTVLDRVKIITPSGIKLINHTTEDDILDPEDDILDPRDVTYAYKLSSRFCACGKQLMNYQEHHCSVKCLHIYKKKTPSKNVQYRECPVCNEIKLFKLAKQIVCSKACAAIRGNEQRAKIPPQPIVYKPCPVCNKT